MLVVGADIGGHHIAAARVDLASDAIVAGSYRHRETDPDATADDLIATWAAVLRDVAGAIDSVGIAMPGPFDYAAGTAWFAVNAKFRALYGVDVGARLRDAGGFGAIRFLNDATAFAVGCHRVDMARVVGRAIGVTLGTGLGGAFLDDGVPVIAGDTVPPGGRLWDLPFRGSIADDYVSARWIVGAARKRLGVDAAGVREIAVLARGDAAARAIFDDYGASLGAIVAPWAARFGAATLMLGGRITGAYDLFGPALADALDGAARVVVHEDTEDAAIAGAAACFDPDFWAVARHRLPDR